MVIDIEEAPGQIKLTTLEDLSTQELQRLRCKAAFDDRYSVEILRRALVEQTDEAWVVLQQCFSETVRNWFRGHPNRSVALLRDSEENYIAQTFSRFWYALRDQHLEFISLYSALGYLHATLNGLIIDTLRFYLRLRSREIAYPEPGCSHQPMAEDSINDQSVWDSIQCLLTDERERRLAYLLYYCGLKPRDIIIHCPQEFDDVKVIYRMNHQLVERLRRNKDQLRHLLDDVE